MKSIFKDMDTDNSGTISSEEMIACLENGHGSELQTYFEALDINATDSATLFTLLDYDGSGEVDINEFCDGCLRLRGPAKAFDINCLWYDHRRTSKQSKRCLERFSQQVMQQ